MGKNINKCAQIFTLDNFFNANLGLLCIADTDGNFIKVNRAWEDFLGLPSHQLEKMRFVDFVHPDDLAATLDTMEKLANQQLIVNFVNRYRSKDGSYRHLKWKFHPQGKYIYAAAEDVTVTVQKREVMTQLVSCSEKFLQMMSTEIDYQLITDYLLNLSEAKYCAFNLHHPDDGTSTTVSISGVVDHIHKAGSILGFNLIGAKWMRSLFPLARNPRKIITHFPNLTALTKNCLSPDKTTLVEKIFNLGEVVQAKVRINGTSVGDFVLFMPAGKLFTNYMAVEVFTRQVGLLVRKKQVDQEILTQKARFKSLFTNTTDAMVFIDTELNVFNVNQQFTNLFGYTLEEIQEKGIGIIVRRPYGEMESYALKILQGETIKVETVRYSKTGREIPVLIKGGPIYIDGKITGGYIVYSDITERKEYEKQLEYLSLHDQLTGLYNRNFFEAKLKSLQASAQYPISIMTCDVDGLKIINDTLGHYMGDKLLKVCAKLLSKSLRQTDILARIGGDEFVALLPKVNRQEGEKIIKNIYQRMEQYNLKHPKLPLSLSIGIAQARDPTVSLVETFKKADERMYHAKLIHKKSSRSQIIESLMAALAEKDYHTDGHSQRLTNHCIALGKKLNLPANILTNLSLLAQVHDLGKVGIPDAILLKAGPLTDEEWEVMKKHPEKGYRIAMSSPDLAPVADLILKHHENWDGTGYPLGIKGSDIPIECRILAIVDAYDAMISNRPYRKAMSKKEAIRELKRCAGSQFDPRLVELFISVLSEEHDQ